MIDINHDWRKHKCSGAGDEKFYRSLQLEGCNFAKLRHTQILDTVTEPNWIVIRKTVLFTSLHNMFTRGQLNGQDMYQTAAEIYSYLTNNIIIEKCDVPCMLCSLLASSRTSLPTQ
jgi:hypothetical protein